MLEVKVAKVAAVVVGYMPEIDVLDRLLISLSSQVDVLIFLDNGGSSRVLMGAPVERQSLVYVDMEGNKGLGAALNKGFELAVKAAVDYVVTFDQDSHAEPELIAKLGTAMAHAKLKDPRCVAVSPAFFDRRDGKKVNFPFYRSVNGVIKPVFYSDDEHGLVKVDILITSGMYISTQAWIGGYRYDEGLFVDFTDSEWCFRVRGQGYSLYGCLNVEMGHALSDAPPVKLFGLSFLRYSPVRRYFFFRATVAVCRMNHTPACWKKTSIVGIGIAVFCKHIDRQKQNPVSEDDVARCSPWLAKQTGPTALI